ncbi:MAG: peroxiredoxin [Bdellovibrionota bacterium]
MNRLLNCQKIRHVLCISLFIGLYTFSLKATATPKTVTVNGVIESLNELDNAYEIRLKDNKRTFKITKATAMKEEDLVTMKDSFEKKTAVDLTVKGSEVLGIKTAASSVEPSPADQAAAGGKIPVPGKAVLGGKAPDFVAKTHEGQDFKLADRAGQWTVLYFYPKAETPGCTKQACAFRDSIKVIRALNADVFGISADTVKEQAAFHKNHNLTFTLIADPDAKIIEQYGVKMPMMKMAKRSTFILDPDLKIAKIFVGVDPVKDAGNVAKELKKLQAKK